jgi:hypothetical protein
MSVAAGRPGAPQAVRRRGAAAVVAAGALALALAGGCTRENPAFLGPQDDAGVTPDAGTGPDDGAGDAAEGDGAERRDGGPADGAGAGEDAASTGCVPDTKACVGDLLATCEAGGTWTPLAQCPSLCVPTPEPHCGGFTPVNGLPACGGDDSTFADYVADAPGAVIIFDTDAGTIVTAGNVQSWPHTLEVAQTGAPPIRVFKFNSLLIPAGTTVVAVGSKALGIWAQRDVVVAGALRLNGDLVPFLTTAIAPAGTWTTASTWAGGAGGAAVGDSGGGGGGFGASGGAGGQGIDGSTAGGGAGDLYPGAELVPLRGGSPGGTAVSADRAQPYGGGAVQIVACHSFSLRVGGVVSAGGSGGPAGGFFSTGGLIHGGFGGGSGGAILIESPLIHLAAAVAANGGGGGGGTTVSGTTGAAGRGEDGRDDATPAAGGSAAGPAAGAGGSGGATAAPAGAPGGAAVEQGSSAGGGGGAVGRVRFNITTLVRADLGLVEESGTVISPAATKGKHEAQ